MPDISIERRGIATWIRFERPERRNAFTADTLSELVEAIRDNQVDSHVIVITGSGSAFCAGGFLGNLAEPDPQRVREMFASCLNMLETIRRCPRPVLAAVNGAAIGGGNELVIGCDLAVAAERATFGQTGVSVGSAPVLGGTNLLAMSIGEKRAKEVAFMCRRYTAAEAMDLGWINAVVPDEELETEAQAWVDRLGEMSPRYLEIAKISSNVWYEACRESFSSGLGMLAQAIGSEDMIEGAKAFMEKRKPSFAPAGTS